MRMRLITLALLVAVLTAFVITPAIAGAAPKPALNLLSNIPVNFTSSSGSFTGNLNITQFQQIGGQIYAVGKLTGTVTNAAGAVVGTVFGPQIVVPLLPLTTSPDPSSSYPILHLTLRPIDLTLLGLHVSGSEITVDITAGQSQGVLLGNLLRSIAHLLDSNNLNLLTNLLNKLLRL